MIFTRLLVVLLLGFSGGVSAQNGAQNGESLERTLDIKKRSVETLALIPTFISAVERQNDKRLTQSEILLRDALWIDNNGGELAEQLADTTVGRFLKSLISLNDNFTEAFLTDNQGANVAAYPTTSDYWQGDEAKWIASFNDGQGAIYVGPLERDESTGTVQVQISAPVRSGTEVVGVLVVGISTSYSNQEVR